MWEHFFSHLMVAAYVLIVGVIAFYGFHRYLLVYLYVKHRHDGYTPKDTFASLPRVTVQLPMFNEDTVAERVIKAHLNQISNAYWRAVSENGGENGGVTAP